MKKAKALKKGDRVAIVSLSNGILGEDFCSHYIPLGSRRLKEFGLEPVFMPNALKGCEFLKAHPEARAADLKAAFADNSISGIICAIGGDDTYRLIPYLMEDPEFCSLIMNRPKVFTGFSDTTINHLMLRRLGLNTFYGPNFINDLSEMADDMLPYTKDAFGRYLSGKNREIKSSAEWYEERSDFSPAAIGTNRISHKEAHGFELIQGKGTFSGELLGGCLESFYDIFTSQRYADQKEICDKYAIFPSFDEWRGKILFIETCEEQPSPEVLCKELDELKKRGVFDAVNGVIIGKPQNEVYYDEYKEVYRQMLKPELPVLYNVNFGHAYPHAVIPYGIKAEICAEKGRITLLEDMLDYDV